LGNQSV